MESAEKRIRASGSSSRRYCRTQELTVRSANTEDIEAWLSLWRSYCAALDGPVSDGVTQGVSAAHSRAGRADLVPSRLSQRGRTNRERNCCKIVFGRESQHDQCDAEAT